MKKVLSSLFEQNDYELGNLNYISRNQTTGLYSTPFKAILSFANIYKPLIGPSTQAKRDPKFFFEGKILHI